MKEKEHPQICIRESVETKNLIKELGGSFAEIWRLGKERFFEITPGNLAEKAHYHQKMYIQCNDKLAICKDTVYTQTDGLTKICQQYIDSGRSIEHPDSYDLSWVKAKIKDMEAVSVNKFFEYMHKMQPNNGSGKGGDDANISD